MSDLSLVTTIEIPIGVIRATHAHLRRVGEEGLEAFVLWAGAQENAVFRVHEAVIPEQTGRRGREGVCVVVGGDALHRLNLLLHERQWTLVAQIHSHPTDAYHSDTDDSFPIVTRVGGLSIVVPDFAVRPFSFADCAVYRLSSDGRWQELDHEALWSLFRIDEKIEN